MMRLLRLLLLVAAAAPVIGQGEAEPYFALSSSRTFASKGKPSVALSAWNVDALEFRVYRIQDAVTFFQQLEDPRQFGGRVAAPPRERTALERLRAWKRGLRANVRRSLRAQFTSSPSAHLETLFPREASPAKPVSRETHYAQAPLLNSQQLALSFVQPVRSHSRWERQTVEVGVREKGVYLVEAVRGELRAYTILIVSDVVMITKTGRGRIVNLVVDRHTGEPLPGAEIWMLTRGGRKTVTKTDADGIAEIAVTAARPEDLRIIGRREADVAANILSSYAFSTSLERWAGYVYSDRPVYRPGHTVRFKGILRVRTPAGYEVPAGRTLAAEILEGGDKPVYRKQLTANANGTIRDELALSAGAALGYYSIEVRAGEAYMNGSFEVEEYKKPEYEVRVAPAKTRVLQGETVQAVIDSRYYFGEPVSGATVKYSVSRGRYWFPLWYDPDEESAEPPPEDDAGDGERLAEGEGKLDQDGKLTIPVETRPSQHKLDYQYRIETRVSDQAKREISGSGWLLATYGSFVLNVTPDRYFYEPGGKGVFSVQARDYDSKPVSTKVHVELIQWNWRNPARSEVKAATDVVTGAEGAATAELGIPAHGDSYRVRAAARTPEVSSFVVPLWPCGTPLRSRFDAAKSSDGV